MSFQGSLPEADKITLEVAKILKEAFLAQNGFALPTMELLQLVY